MAGTSTTAFPLPGRTTKPDANQLVFRLRPHESINLAVQARQPGLEMATEKLILHADYPGSDKAGSIAAAQLHGHRVEERLDREPMSGPPAALGEGDRQAMDAPGDRREPS